MKKLLITVSLFALLIISAEGGFTHLVRLTVINKSSLPVELKLSGSDEENIYYLRIPRGDPDDPLVKTFTVVADRYSATAYYVEPWDPVYGYDCNAKSNAIIASSNVKITILECNRTVGSRGEMPSFVKFGSFRPKLPNPTMLIP